MPTAIPPTVFTRITQTNYFPEIIAYLLNEAEATYSSRPKHSNAKYVYPFWKACQVCFAPFPCETKEQVGRKKACSAACAGVLLQAPRPHCRKPKVCCAACGQLFRPARRQGLRASRFCSTACSARSRAADPSFAERMRAVGALGRAGWTAESHASYQAKMNGANNPAWKGGVTYFKTHGSYIGVKYVRCPAAYLSMARKDGYVMEHRLLVAQAMGRPLLRTEVVHHIDHDPTNNTLSNLLLFSSNQEHKLYEGRGSPAPIWSLSSPSPTMASSGA